MFAGWGRLGGLGIAWELRGLGDLHYRVSMELIVQRSRLWENRGQRAGVEGLNALSPIYIHLYMSYSLNSLKGAI